MKVKVSEASGIMLDWLVGKALGEYRPVTVPSYSTDWSQGGPIIDREKIATQPYRIIGTTESGKEIDEFDGWQALTLSKRYWMSGAKTHFGPTPLIAAMRCYVTSKLGDEVEVPDEFLEN